MDNIFLCLLKTDEGSVEPQPATNGIVVAVKLMFLTSNEIGKQIGWISSGNICKYCKLFNCGNIIFIQPYRTLNFYRLMILLCIYVKCGKSVIGIYIL